MVSYDRKKIETALMVLSPILSLLLLFASILLSSHNYREEFLASAAVAKDSITTTAGNATNSTNTNHTNNVTTLAGSQHVYRGGAAAGSGGE